MNEQQLINYLYWLKERGQTYPGLAPSSLDSSQGPGDSKPNEPTQVAVEAVRLLFISQSPLVEAERDMVSRIAAALGLKPTDFRIITADEASRFASDFAIGLGQAAVSLPLVLTIPHPGDMLREPQLKVSAWGNLQKIKGLLH